MSYVAKYLTHADRARRRAEIRRDIAAAKPIKVIARERGLTVRYIRQIAKDAGLQGNPGRPRGSRWWFDCPAHLVDDYDFLTRRKRIPVAEVRQMLEAA